MLAKSLKVEIEPVGAILDFTEEFILYMTQFWNF
jgi:hypothetical protein